MSSKTVAIAIGVMFAAALAGIWLLSSSQKPVFAPQKYAPQAKKKPAAKVKENSYDFGKIKVSSTVEKRFVVKNAGAAPLQLYSVSTSCGCTAVKIIYEGKISREFSMHSSSKEVFVVKPGGKAIIEVVYRPFVMPQYGQVAREVYMSTNDPQNPKLIFKVAAFVE